MNEIVERALFYWGMEGANYELIAARENIVFKIDHVDGSTALRLHRKNYRSDAELRSELNWIQAISKGGLKVPASVPSVSGDLLIHLDGIVVDMLSWLSGTTLDSAMEVRSSKDRSLLFRSLGRDMARLHEISDSWSLPDEFERATWDIEGLLGEVPLWGQFWENPKLESEDKLLLKHFQQVATDALVQCQNTLDYGLIHADLVPGNVLVRGQTLNLIDFDDGGFGFRNFDVATALHKHMDEDDYLSLRAALIQGYSSIRTIDLATLDLFSAIRAATYVGWNITRMTENGGAERNTRFIHIARQLIQNYLN